MWKIGRLKFQCQDKNCQFFYQIVSKTKKLSIDTLLDEMKPVVVGDKLGGV